MAISIKKGFGRSKKNMLDSPNQAWMIGTFDADASYPTGGYPFDLDEPVWDVWAHGGQYIWRYNRSTKKMQAFTHAGTTPNILLQEAANGANLSAEVGIQWIAFMDHVN